MEVHILKGKGRIWGFFDVDLLPLHRQHREMYSVCARKFDKISIRPIYRWLSENVVSLDIEVGVSNKLAKM